MGNVRFRRSVKIAPGVRVNFNKKSISTTIGPKGMHYTISSNGKTTKSIGVPGTGLYYTESSNIKKDKQVLSESTRKNTHNSNKATVNAPANGTSSRNETKFYKKPIWIIVLLLCLPPVGVYLVWAYTNWSKTAKTIISIIFLVLFLVGIVSSCLSDGKKTDSTSIPENAIVTEVDGVWGLYADGVLLSDYSGIATNDYGSWIIKEGLVDFTYNGPYSSGDTIYTVVNGKVT